MSDQRIRSVRLYRVSAPVDPPRGVSIRLATAHAYVLVKLVDEAGRVGWGETYDQFGMFEVVRDLAGLLIGHEPWPMRHHRDRMAITRTSSEARSALMIALDDLRGHQAGLPVHRLYGGPTRDHVTAHAASQGYLDGVPPEETWPEEVAAFVGAGFQAVKLRIGRFDIAREVALLGRVREMTPSSVQRDHDGPCALGGLAGGHFRAGDGDATGICRLRLRVTGAFVRRLVGARVAPERRRQRGDWVCPVSTLDDPRPGSHRSCRRLAVRL